MITRAQFLQYALAPLAVRDVFGIGPPKFISHFYYVEDNAARQSLTRNARVIDVLSPAWLTVNAQGKVESTVDPRVLRAAAAANATVMPTLVNKDFQADIASLVLTDDDVQSGVIGSVRDLVAQYGFAGIQLDFEEIGAIYRETLSQFTARLARELRPLRARVTVAVPAPLLPGGGPDATGVAWSPNPRAAAFDYRALAASASWLTLMAYDEYTWGGQPGPVAGMPWVRACIEHVREQAGPSSMLLGLPLYHRRWTGQKVSDGPFAAAAALAVKHSAIPVMHRVQQEKVLSFEEGPVQNVVWFNDAESLRLRVALVKEYGLAGYSAWRLGQEDPEVWKSVFTARGGGA